MFLSACSLGLPGPVPTPPSVASPTFLGVYDGPSFSPPGCFAMYERPSFGGAMTAEWRCEVGGALDLPAYTTNLRRAADAQGWRECTPGLLFVRSELVMQVAINADPPPRPPSIGPAPGAGHREIAVTIAYVTRTAPTC